MSTNMENKTQFFSEESVASFQEREKERSASVPMGGKNDGNRLFLFARAEVFMLAAVSLSVLFYGVFIEEKPMVAPDVPAIPQRGYVPSTIVDTPLDANKQKGGVRGADSSGAPSVSPPAQPNTSTPEMSPTANGTNPSVPATANTNSRTPQSILLSIRERLLVWHQQTGRFSGYATTSDPTWRFPSPTSPNCVVTPFISVSPTGQEFEVNIRPDCGEVSFVYCIDTTLDEPIIIPFSEVNSAMTQYRCRATP